MKPDFMKYIPAKEKTHYMKCADCGNYFDMRDLQQVFAHFHKSAALNSGYSESIRIDGPADYTKRKRKNGSP